MYSDNDLLFYFEFVKINYTICPRSSDPFYIVTYVKWVTTSWTHSNSLPCYASSWYFY